MLVVSVVAMMTACREALSFVSVLTVVPVDEAFAYWLIRAFAPSVVDSPRVTIEPLSVIEEVPTCDAAVNFAAVLVEELEVRVTGFWAKASEANRNARLSLSFIHAFCRYH